MVWQIDALQLMEVHDGADIHLQPMEDPVPEQYYHSASSIQATWTPTMIPLAAKMESPNGMVTSIGDGV
ncbi:hypothetical protein llap_5374 [Limosa lapponica baueri]|uniref:Uncharacterized protein n=1 Tax=Limosa lapponica baueri TaxID=1758121 RepID=A0A2I0UE36_LIMLA|nr:hypothetical protein llap_5374 [Limosa lapponica baueri]